MEPPYLATGCLHGPVGIIDLEELRGTEGSIAIFKVYYWPNHSAIHEFARDLRTLVSTTTAPPSLPQTAIGNLGPGSHCVPSSGESNNDAHRAIDKLPLYQILFENIQKLAYETPKHLLLST